MALQPIHLWGSPGSLPAPYLCERGIVPPKLDRRTPDPTHFALARHKSSQLQTHTGSEFALLPHPSSPHCTPLSPGLLTVHHFCAHVFYSQRVLMPTPPLPSLGPRPTASPAAPDLGPIPKLTTPPTHAHVRRNAPFSFSAFQPAAVVLRLCSGYRCRPFGIDHSRVLVDLTCLCPVGGFAQFACCSISTWPSGLKTGGRSPCHALPPLSLQLHNHAQHPFSFSLHRNPCVPPASILSCPLPLQSILV